MCKYNKEDLEKLILIDKLSYEEIGKQYDVTGAAIKKAALRLGIELIKRRKINGKETFNKGVELVKRDFSECKTCGKSFVKYASSFNIYCSHTCQKKYEHNVLYQKFLSGDEFFQRSNYSPSTFKSDILLEQDNKCNICGINNEWNGKPMTFVLDHIDGNASNNLRNNLRLICHNCDSQLDTYKSKNKNSARKERYK
jgi:hypothetical protein